MSVPGAFRRPTVRVVAGLAAVGAVAVGIARASPLGTPSVEVTAHSEGAATAPPVTPPVRPVPRGSPGTPARSTVPSGRVDAPGDERAALDFEEAARTAFAYLERQRQPGTGLVKATESWGVVTTWDVGSTLAGVHAAGELGLLPPSETEAWLAEILGTLREMPLYEGVAYNKAYRASDGRMANADGGVSSKGQGWSVTDQGRLLIWLRIVADRYPDLAGDARDVAARIDFGQLIEDGYLMGATAGVGRYPEARVGYEQYAARGFELWDHVAERSLDLEAHTRPVEVLGQTLVEDLRGGGKLTSEPFVLMGLELGWPEGIDRLARALLAVQEARYRDTGVVTIISEDALQHPPYYFYYYTAWSDGRPFVVKAQGPMRKPGPRWVSAKAAYAWHALLPGDYTRVAVERVAPAATAGGWASGVFEKSGRSTAVRNVNTAGVILESALYERRGRPFLPGG